MVENLEAEARQIAAALFGSILAQNILRHGYGWVVEVKYQSNIDLLAEHYNNYIELGRRIVESSSNKKNGADHRAKDADNNDIPAEIHEALLNLRSAFKSSGFNPIEIRYDKMPKTFFTTCSYTKEIENAWLNELPNCLYGIRIVNDKNEIFELYKRRQEMDERTNKDSLD